MHRIEVSENAYEASLADRIRFRALGTLGKR